LPQKHEKNYNKNKWLRTTLGMSGKSKGNDYLVEQVLPAVRRGDLLILVDSEDRENEGDLYVAAERATPEAINFMAKHGRGLVCLALTPDRCDELDLPLMAAKNESPLETAFTVTIEAVEGVNTGISAHDRAKTIQVAIDPGASPSDLRQPGLSRPAWHADGAGGHWRGASLRPPDR
jgi:3,4-dihydroxy 2-butanone 4-phosphate synthase/GTP cyclohydrolase II